MTFKPQSQFPVAYFFQQGYFSQTSLHLVTNWEPCVQKPKSIGDIFIQTTTLWDIFPSCLYLSFKICGVISIPVSTVTNKFMACLEQESMTYLPEKR